MNLLRNRSVGVVISSFHEAAAHFETQTEVRQAGNEDTLSDTLSDTPRIQSELP
jgi:hypothetical protein